MIPFDFQPAKPSFHTGSITLTTTKTGFTAPGYDVDSHCCWYKQSVWSPFQS